jgi:ammonium transporter, Amt family
MTISANNQAGPQKEILRFARARGITSSLIRAASGDFLCGNMVKKLPGRAGILSPRGTTCVESAREAKKLTGVQNRPALAIGAIADRGRMLPAIVFIFVWGTIVYDPIAYWTWNANGWLFDLGSLDFAGGTPVHISSGAAALAYSLMLGKRTGYGKVNGLPFRPHNVTHVVLGTVFLWVGWFGFNGGSALASNLRAVMACLVTNLAASMGGITWVLLDYRLEQKWSTIGFCSGAISGLVAITPGSGFVTPWAAVVFGIVGATACNFATKIKFLIGVDDALDVFAVHAVGGMVGNILTGIFAA